MAVKESATKKIENINNGRHKTAIKSIFLKNKTITVVIPDCH